ncbi:hypothetical protein [Kribbella sp. C-35]|uniref:hypothetical protein n=1 Tax=Kribbella sp. C-35 TaxID=2789276 RepID=UPI003977F680
MTSSRICSLRRIRLWFGDTVITTFGGDAHTASRYAAAMRRRFPGLRVSDDPVAERQ